MKMTGINKFIYCTFSTANNSHQYLPCDSNILDTSNISKRCKESCLHRVCLGLILESFSDSAAPLAQDVMIDYTQQCV